MSDGVARQRRRIPAPWVDVGARFLALSIGAGTSVQSFFMAEGSQRLGADRAALVTFGVAALVAAAWSTAGVPAAGEPLASSRTTGGGACRGGRRSAASAARFSSSRRESRSSLSGSPSSG